MSGPPRAPEKLSRLLVARENTQPWCAANATVWPEKLAADIAVFSRLCRAVPPLPRQQETLLHQCFLGDCQRKIRICCFGYGWDVAFSNTSSGERDRGFRRLGNEKQCRYRRVDGDSAQDRCWHGEHALRLDGLGQEAAMCWDLLGGMVCVHGWKLGRRFSFSVSCWSHAGGEEITTSTSGAHSRSSPAA